MNVNDSTLGTKDAAALLGTKDAAALLGLSVPRVKQLAADGRIGRKIAGRYLFSPAEIQRFKKIDRPAGNPSFSASANA